MLADLFGVHYAGETEEAVTYIAPGEDAPDLFIQYSTGRPLTLNHAQVHVRAAGDTQILATTTLPYTNPKDATRFASAISNPPGKETPFPAVVINRYGQGRVMYAAGQIEAMDSDAHRAPTVETFVMVAVDYL